MRQQQTFVALLFLAAFPGVPMANESDFYDSEPGRLQAKIVSFANAICEGTTGGRQAANFLLACIGSKCTAKGEFTSSSLVGDVYLTNEYRFLFPKPKDEAIERPIRRRTVDGVELVVEGPFKIELDKKIIEGVNDCYLNVGQRLGRVLSDSSTYSASNFREIAAKNGDSLTIKPRDVKLEFGQVSIAYPPSIDIRKDAILSIEIVASQKFLITVDPFPIDYFDSILRKNKAETLAHSKSHGSASTQQFGYHNDRLTAVSNQIKSVSIQVTGDDVAITPLTPSRQVLRPLIPASWAWKAHFGERNDAGILRIIVSNADLPFEQGAIQVHAVDVNLEKPWDYRIKNFVSNYWQWIIATVLLPYVIQPMKARFLHKKRKTHIPFKEKVKGSSYRHNAKKPKDRP